MENLTPMMQQYMKIKSQYKDAIVFFRLGDFFEMFFDDAITASKELEIALTQRDCGLPEKAPMCGIPHHVSESYISKLVDKGYKVAICDQLEDPTLAKGIVKRDVVRVVTPGTIIDSIALDDKTNNFLVSIYLDNFGVGISYVDNSTGEMYTTEFLDEEDNCFRFIVDELGKTLPSEIICNEELTKNNRYMKIIKNRINPYINVYETDDLIEENIKNKIKEQFKVKNLDKLNLKDKIYSLISTSKLIDYLISTQKSALDHINNIIFYESKNYMVMDINTRANLEILETIKSRDKKGALIGILDKTKTAMGGRLLKKWLEQPLLDIKDIQFRLNIVDYFYNNLMLLDDLRRILNEIYDMERLIGKISNGNCNGRDLIALKNSLENIPDLKNMLINSEFDDLKNMGMQIDNLQDVFELIDKSIVESPPISVKDGGLIKNGFNKDLDDFRDSSLKGKEWLSSLEQNEKNKTGIKNLKIGYNRIAGYFIEVTKSNLNMVPDYFIRKQTLANSERYYTEELKNMESKILGAEEKALNLEYEIFQNIRNSIKQEIIRIQVVSKEIANIDVLTNFALVGKNNNFVRPQLNTKGLIIIEEGRHPVVEYNIDNHLFVPNDTYLDNNKNMIQIITGPNMAGKSTYMRQVAIITLLAQIGSFVPAKHANIGVVDRIFTRIGASDNLSQGESTFMVEMNEVSNIIKLATKNSLIILDEVGRGTSTYDGLSIAWAVVEYIAENVKAKTLFATHYHELTQLQEKLSGIINLTITAEERGDDIVFLRKIVKGSTNRSYGIQVARLAGIHQDIINRANEVLSIIEGSHEINLNNTPKNNSKQLNLLDYKKDYFIDRIKNIDIDSTSPKDALNILYSLIEDANSLKERA